MAAVHSAFVMMGHRAAVSYRPIDLRISLQSAEFLGIGFPRGLAGLLRGGLVVSRSYDDSRGSD
jgi:hypothetical protein